MAEEDGRGGVRSIARTLALLDVLGARGELTLGELAAAGGLPLSTAHRLLAALVDAGYVVQDRRMGRYRLSHKVLGLSRGLALWAAGPKGVVGPHLQAIRDATGETTSFAVLEGLEAVYVDQAGSPHPVGTFARIGRRVPAHATAVGKAILAHLPEASVEALYATEPFPKLTRRTIVTAAELRSELARIRRRGHALDREEYQEGVVCLAVPIVDGSGDACGAISVSAPAARMRRLRREDLAEQLAGRAAACARELAERGAGASPRAARN